MLAARCITEYKGAEGYKDIQSENKSSKSELDL